MTVNHELHSHYSVMGELRQITAANGPGFQREIPALQIQHIQPWSSPWTGLTFQELVLPRITPVSLFHL